MTKRILTQEQLKTQLHYDLATGIFTRLIRARVANIGDVAGSLSGRYLSIRLLGERYQAHRLAWLYVTGSMPKEHIDHINGNKLDNRFCNLREATSAQNSMNMGKNSANTSGIKGVTFHTKQNKWRASCRVNGKRFYLGNFETKELATFAYQSFAKSNHGDFYHE